MTKTINTLALVVTLVLMTSVTNKQADFFIGTYSTTAADPSQIKLIINSDHTFYYQDFSIAAKKIICSGIWEQRNTKVFLTDEKNNGKFHAVWTFKNNGEKAKSRKGFTFYSLVKSSN
jgi:hypothetical protein